MTRQTLRRPAWKDIQMTSRPVARRGVFLGAGTLLASGLLAACASEPETPPAPPEGPAAGEPTPVNTAEQFTTSVSEVNAAVVAADKARDVKKLAPRVSGSATDFRKAAYAMIDEAEEWATFLSVPSDTLKVPMTTVTTEFPRMAIALVEDSAEDGVPFFMALQQADAQSPYTSWGWAQQAVGIEMPSVPNEVVGAEKVALDAEDLVMAPAAALELYAAVLTDGDRANPDGLLAADPFQTERHKQIQTERTELNGGVEKDEAATIRETYAVKEEEFVGLRTDDGGAIVIGTLLSTRTVSIKDGATMRYGDDNLYTKVIGKKEFTKEYIRKYGAHVALFIPAKDSGEPIQPIAATLTTLGASGE
ncbi:hypothetical protein [Brachybacterium sp. FME24]|uniref:hypothetical protein n=1 Tax=Brachybacterium sp. FME24 TaxID=2742605 RepID=UPI001866642B|nr:hypothetical protein [Brachybacterium sp. FME24]